MGVVTVVVLLAVAGIALAWWWVGRARAVERNARSAAGRAEIEARIAQQYRSAGGNPPANRRP